MKICTYVYLVHDFDRSGGESLSKPFRIDSQGFVGEKCVPIQEGGGAEWEVAELDSSGCGVVLIDECRSYEDLEFLPTTYTLPADYQLWVDEFR